MPKKDDRVTKHRVTMRSVTLSGDGRTVTTEAVDYVRPDFLDAYVAAARTGWQFVEVSDEPDAGPGGYNGATTIPAGLEHPLAGSYYPASGDPKAKAAPEGYAVITDTPGV